MPTKTVNHGSKIGTKGYPRHFKALGLEPPTKVIDLAEAGTVEDQRSLTPEEQAQVHWRDLRAQRDRLLAETDWLVLRNLETSEPVAPEWLAYRQALRDLPENTDDPASPVWPEVPQV